MIFIFYILAYSVEDSDEEFRNVDEAVEGQLDEYRTELEKAINSEMTKKDPVAPLVAFGAKAVASGLISRLVKRIGKRRRNRNRKG